MICPNCNKEIEDGSRFCTYCGEKLIKPVAPINPFYPIENEKKENQQTSGERLLVSFCRTIMYLAIAALMLAGLSKVVYVEDVKYGFEDEAVGHYVYGDSPTGRGDCIVIIKMYPLLKISGLNAACETEDYESIDEMKTQIGKQRQRAYNEYDESINAAIVYMVIAVVATIILYMYVRKLCEPK